jgi:hypothetical protein
MYLVYDGRRFKALTQAVLLAVSLAVTVRLLVVFPFDFSGYAFNWGALMRVVLIIGVAGSAIGIISSIVQAVRPQRPEALDT